jgi:CAAX protease family protein
MSFLRTVSAVWLFFAAVFCWTWSFWIITAVLGINAQTTAGQTLLRLGLLGPMLGGIGFTYLKRNKRYARDYWLRIVDPKRIPAKRFLIIFLFVPVLMAIAVVLDVVLGDNDTLGLIRDRVARFGSAPATLAPFALAVFINGPFPEELGWRGYALDQLQAKWNAVLSSFVLGSIWALWHLPLFFMPGMLHAKRGVGSAWFWLFMLGIIPTAVIYTWIFNNTRRSTLAAIVFHFMSNVTYEIGNVSDGTFLYATLLWFLSAIVVVAVWRAGTVGGRGDRR